MQVVDANTVQLNVTYQEPTKSADGTPLGDLAYTTVYYQIDNQAIQKVPQVPASSLGGGGNITAHALIPVASGSKADVLMWATATDTMGNESAKSATASQIVDRIAPAPPSGFSVA